MRVLVACEFSGIVRDAFIARGHSAVSVDLIDTEAPGPHVVGDILDPVVGDKVMDALDGPAELGIFHPPCTYLSNSGVRWLYGGKGKVIDRERWAKMENGARFFAALLSLPIPRIAVENPIMHGYAKDVIARTGALDALGRVSVTTVQPYQFGTPETKATQLWLINLPPLVPTNVVDGRTPRVHYASPGPDRWKERSRTDPGIAAAMADQWGSL
jgi:hypothetical protein